LRSRLAVGRDDREPGRRGVEREGTLGGGIAVEDRARAGEDEDAAFGGGLHGGASEAHVRDDQVEDGRRARHACERQEHGDDGFDHRPPSLCVSTYLRHWPWFRNGGSLKVVQRSSLQSAAMTGRTWGEVAAKRGAGLLL